MIKLKKEHINYFDEFNNVASQIVSNAKLVRETINDYNPEKIEEISSSSHSIENAADKIVHAIRNELIKDFIPPIEREDIANLSHKIDDVEDHIDEIMIKFKMLNITSIREDLKEMGEILHECSLQLKIIFDNFKAFENPKSHDLIFQEVIIINSIEERADKLYQKVMTNLYKTEVSPIEIIKWTSIYTSFEDAVDSLEEVGNLVGDIVMKNS